MTSVFAVLVLASVFASAQAVPTPLALRPTVRRWGEGGPCARVDSVCMNKMAVEYTNEVRARAGKAAIESGTKYMYENAMQHSKNMMNGAPFEHQPIQEGLAVGIGSPCETTLTGENIAYDFVPFSGPSNPAKICVDAWEKSPGHYRNMIGDHVNTVVGITISADDKIYCTQTFSKKAATGTGMCANPDAGPVSRKPISNPNPAPPPGSSRPPSNLPRPAPAPACPACNAGTQCNPRDPDYRCVGGRCVRTMEPEAVLKCHPAGVPKGNGNRLKCQYCDDSAQCNRGVCINHQCFPDATYEYLVQCERLSDEDKSRSGAFVVPNALYFF